MDVTAAAPTAGGKRTHTDVHMETPADVGGQARSKRARHAACLDLDKELNSLLQEVPALVGHASHNPLFQTKVQQQQSQLRRALDNAFQGTERYDRHQQLVSELGRCLCEYVRVAFGNPAHLKEVKQALRKLADSCRAAVGRALEGPRDVAICDLVVKDIVTRRDKVLDVLWDMGVVEAHSAPAMQEVLCVCLLGIRVMNMHVYWMRVQWADAADVGVRATC